MVRYRSRLQIIADMLSVVRRGSKKTHIMYQANLSYKPFTAYLNEVMEAGLMILTNDSSYEITQKGITFMDRFKEYSEQRKQLQEHVERFERAKSQLEKLCLVG